MHTHTVSPKKERTGNQENNEHLFFTKYDDRKYNTQLTNEHEWYFCNLIILFNISCLGVSQSTKNKILEYF